MRPKAHPLQRVGFDSIRRNQLGPAWVIRGAYMRPWIFRKWGIAFLTVSFFTLSIGAIVMTNWKTADRYIAYQYDQERYHHASDPVLRGLADRTYGPGTSAETFLNDNPSAYALRYDNFIEIYFPIKDEHRSGIHIFAIDNKLVYAINGFWSYAHVFYDTMTDWDRSQHKISFYRWKEKVDEKEDAPFRAIGSTAGVAGYKTEFSYIPTTQP